jgi:hypothetical protein
VLAGQMQTPDEEALHDARRRCREDSVLKEDLEHFWIVVEQAVKGVSQLCGLSELEGIVFPSILGDGALDVHVGTSQLRAEPAQVHRVETGLGGTEWRVNEAVMAGQDDPLVWSSFDESSSEHLSTFAL